MSNSYNCSRVSVTRLIRRRVFIFIQLCCIYFPVQFPPYHCSGDYLLLGIVSAAVYANQAEEQYV